MFEIINSFNQIDINNTKTLVICDIDETFISWKKKPEDFVNMLISDFPDSSKEEILNDSNYMHNIYINMYKPVLTDLDGFTNLLNKIDSTCSEIIFLTARSSTNKNFTLKNLNDVGFSHFIDKIHYTDNLISKGEYIKNNIDLSMYNQIIFIDDKELFIKSVNDYFPHIICYKFDFIY